MLDLSQSLSRWDAGKGPLHARLAGDQRPWLLRAEIEGHRGDHARQQAAFGVGQLHLHRELPARGVRGGAHPQDAPREALARVGLDGDVELVGPRGVVAEELESGDAEAIVAQGIDVDPVGLDELRHVAEGDVLAAQGVAGDAVHLVRLGLGAIAAPAPPEDGIELEILTEAPRGALVVAAFAEGKTEITNIAHLHFKESDRINDTAAELNKMGVRTEVTDDTMTIYGGKPAGAEIDSHNDHRLAMSLAVAALFASGESIINGTEAVNKSYPAFFSDLQKLGARVEELL